MLQFGRHDEQTDVILLYYGRGSGGRAPSRRRHGALGGGAPALENFTFFCKNNLILVLF